MVVRIKLTIEQEEYSALLKLSMCNLRNPEGQLRFILRNELIRCGLINNETGETNSGDHEQPINHNNNA